MNFHTVQPFHMALQWTPGFAPLSSQMVTGIYREYGPRSYAFSYVSPYILALLCGFAVGNLHVVTPPPTPSPWRGCWRWIFSFRENDVPDFFRPNCDMI
jgi:hypothetical protein